MTGLSHHKTWEQRIERHSEEENRAECKTQEAPGWNGAVKPFKLKALSDLWQGGTIETQLLTGQM